MPSKLAPKRSPPPLTVRGTFPALDRATPSPRTTQEERLGGRLSGWRSCHLSVQGLARDGASTIDRSTDATGGDDSSSRGPGFFDMPPSASTVRGQGTGSLVAGGSSERRRMWPSLPLESRSIAKKTRPENSGPGDDTPHHRMARARAEKTRRNAPMPFARLARIPFFVGPYRGRGRALWLCYQVESPLSNLVYLDGRKNRCNPPGQAGSGRRRARRVGLVVGVALVLV